MGVWTGEQTAKIIEKTPEFKINPNGVDLKISEIWEISDGAITTINGEQRTIDPEKVKVKPVGNFYVLKRGVYEVRIANKVSIPKNAVGFVFPRSTFNRLGIIKGESAVWDSGYTGLGTQTVFVTVGEARIHKDEFWFQLVLFDMKEDVKQLYKGKYQDERPKE